MSPTASEPWLLPDVDRLPDISVPFATSSTAAMPTGGHFLPYERDLETFARPWAIPGTPGLEHRIGGIEKEAVTGNVSYDPGNHQLMTDSRAWKIANIANDIPVSRFDADEGAEILVLGWGSTFGAIQAAANRLRDQGTSKSPPPTCATSTRSPTNLGEVVRCLSDRSHSRTQQRTAAST